MGGEYSINQCIVVLLDSPPPEHATLKFAYISTALAVAAGFSLPQPACASLLLSPGVGAPDLALAGASVARPRNPAWAIFANPAALAGFEKAVSAVSLGLPMGTLDVRADDNGGSIPAYDETARFLGFAPDYGAVWESGGPWRFGVAIYGSVGANFNFDADPAAGVTEKFFSEVSILTVAPALAYEITDDLSVGLAITPLFGYARAHFAAGALPFRYKLTGPGVQANASVAWRPSKDWRLALGLRTPGMVWMEGSMSVPVGAGASVRQDVKLDLEMPAQVFLGCSRSLGDRLVVDASMRWTGSKSFRGSEIRFLLTPEGNTPFVAGADDEWLVALGTEYRLNPSMVVRGGLSHATSVVGDNGESPLQMDVDDWKLSAGLGFTLGAYTFDLTVGRALGDSRFISVDEARIFPGRYRADGGIVMFGVTTHGRGTDG